MSLIDPAKSLFLVIDLQEKLLPAIHQGEDVVANVSRMQQASDILDIPVLFTEQNPTGLGPTTTALKIPSKDQLITKMTFNSCQAKGFEHALGSKYQIIVSGSEAHVCVLQTVAGLLEMGNQVFVVEDAIGSRTPQNKSAALTRMAQHGAEIVTSEMVLFEWLQSAENPKFRSVLRLVK